LGRRENEEEKENRPCYLSYQQGYSVHGSRQPHSGKTGFRVRKPKLSEKQTNKQTAHNLGSGQHLKGTGKKEKLHFPEDTERWTNPAESHGCSPFRDCGQREKCSISLQE
jgi:hypothetical protein